MRVESLIKQTLFWLKHSNHYDEGEKVAKRSVLKRFQLVIDFLMRNLGLMGSENKEVLVVLRNEKGLESFSKVIVDQNNNVTVTADSDYKLDNGTYTVIASSNNRLYSQKVFVK